jgi:tetratricopeptide (TPR) repeat protein
VGFLFEKFNKIIHICLYIKNECLMNPSQQSEIEALELSLKNIDSSLSEAEKVVSEKKILYQIGKKYDEVQEWTLAQEYLEKALALIPQYTPQEGEESEILFNLAGIQLDQQKFAEANEFYLKILALPENEYWGKAYYGLGFCEMQSQAWDIAIENFEKALNWNTANERTEDLGKNHHLLALAYLQKNQNAPALENFEQSILYHAQHQNYDGVESTVGNIRVFVKEAMRPQNQLVFYNNHISQCEEDNLEDLAGFWYYCAALWYEEEQKSKEAFEHFQKALELHQKHQVETLMGLLYYHLGSFYEEQGKHTLAVEYHAHALEKLMARKQYAKVGLIVYFLQSSENSITDPEMLTKVKDLYQEAETLGLVLESEDFEPEEDPQNPEWVNNESLEENLAAVAKIHQLTQLELEGNRGKAKEVLPQNLGDFLEISLELAERYSQDYKGAWFGRKKKQQKLSEYTSTFLGELDALLDSEGLSPSQKENIAEAKITLSEFE